MIIHIRVKPGSRKNEVKTSGKNSYMINIKEPAEKNKANTALLKELSRFFSVPSSKIRIVRGLKSKNKVVCIGE